MAHGYLREFDERPDRGDDRDRGWNKDRDFRGERDRRFMFEGDRGDRAQSHGADPDRQRAWREFSSRQDDHYLSWRDRQMEALDRDYADYCREREQQFHHDFDAWRNQRHENPQPLQTGMTQSGLSADPSGTMELTNELRDQPDELPDPMATATLGTSSDRKR